MKTFHERERKRREKKIPRCDIHNVCIYTSPHMMVMITVINYHSGELHLSHHTMFFRKGDLDLK